MKTHSFKSAGRHGGFSLVELLATVAVLGILAALIIPAIMPDLAGARAVKAQRNARTIVEMAGNLRVAGVRDVDNTETVKDAVRKMMDGLYGRGVFQNTYFKISEMSDAEIDQSLTYIEKRGGLISLK